MFASFSLYNYIFLTSTIMVLIVRSLIWLGIVNVLNESIWIVNIFGIKQLLVNEIISSKILGSIIVDIMAYILYAGGILGIVAVVYGPPDF